MTILVVDDDEDIRSLLEDRLLYSGYCVLTATNGEEGIACLEAENPDLLLLDLLMPKLDGLSTLKEIRKRRIEITTIVITAHGTVQTAVEAMQAGAFDFLQKPFNPDDVEQKVVRALERVRLVQENRRLQKELAEAQERLIEEMQSELLAAHDMQMGLLPKAAPTIDGAELAGVCIPAKQVGGDYYTYLGKSDGRIGIVVADVSGKGMQAATVAMRFSDLIRYEAEGLDDPQQILLGIDRSLKGRIPMEMFVTCGIAIVDRAAATVSLASAASPEIFHYAAGSRTVRPLGLTGFPLGLPLDLPGEEPFNAAEVGVAPGDLLVFTSDGIEEAQNPQGDMYSNGRLMTVVEAGGREGASARDVRDRIIADAMDFTGGTLQGDDMTVVVLRVT